MRPGFEVGDETLGIFLIFFTVLKRVAGGWRITINGFGLGKTTAIKCHCSWWSWWFGEDVYHDARCCGQSGASRVSETLGCPSNTTSAPWQCKPYLIEWGKSRGD
jgi:hypothetical protein